MTYPMDAVADYYTSQKGHPTALLELQNYQPHQSFEQRHAESHPAVHSDQSLCLFKQERGNQHQTNDQECNTAYFHDYSSDYVNARATVNMHGPSQLSSPVSGVVCE